MLKSLTFLIIFFLLVFNSWGQSQNFTVCINGTTYLSAPSGKSPYSWSPVDPSIAQVITGGGSAQSVILKWIGGNGPFVVICQHSGGTSTFVVNVVNPTPTINGLTTVSGSCNTTTVTYSTPVTNAVNYSWSVTGAVSYTPNGSTVTVNWPAGTSGGTSKSGTVSLWYYTPSPNSCSSKTATLPVTINYPAPPSPTGNTSVTGCTVQTYTASSSNVTWFITGQTNYQANGSTVSVLWPGSGGNGTVRYTIGCTGLSSPTLSVTVSPLPEPVLNAQDAYGNPVDALNLCYNSNASVLDRVYYTTPGKVQYTWTGYSNSTSTQTGGLTNMGVNGVYHGFSSGYYKDISVKYFEPVGAPFNTNCPSPTKTIRVNLLTASIASGLTLVCAPSLNATYTSNDLNYNGVPYSNYFWTAVNGTVVSGQGSATVNVTWNSSGGSTTGLNLSYKNTPLSCTSESVSSPLNPTYPVTIRSNVIVGQSPVIINTAKSYQFIDASGSVTNSFVWNFNGVNTPTADNNVSIVMPVTPGVYTLTGTYQLSSGNLNCTTTKSIDVRLPENCVGCPARKANTQGDEPSGDEILVPAIYPNPANTDIWVSNYPVGTSVHVLTGNGQALVKEFLINENSALKIDASYWSSGLHLLKVIKPDGKQVIHKVIISH
jgi:hypothetical protein